MKFGDYDVFAHGLVHTLPAEVLSQFEDAIKEGYIPKDEIILVFREVYRDSEYIFSWLPITAHPNDYNTGFE
jgi:hypothetical protein